MPPDPPGFYVSAWFHSYVSTNVRSILVDVHVRHKEEMAFGIDRTPDGVISLWTLYQFRISCTEVMEGRWSGQVFYRPDPISSALFDRIYELLTSKPADHVAADSAGRQILDRVRFAGTPKARMIVNTLLRSAEGSL